MHGYKQTCSRLKRENLRALGSQQMGLSFLRPQYPTAGQSHKHPQPNGTSQIMVHAKSLMGSEQSLQND